MTRSRWSPAQPRQPLSCGTKNRGRSSAGSLAGLEFALTGRDRAGADLAGTTLEDVDAALMAPAASIRGGSVRARADHDDGSCEGRHEQACHPRSSVRRHGHVAHPSGAVFHECRIRIHLHSTARIRVRFHCGAMATAASHPAHRGSCVRSLPAFSSTAVEAPPDKGVRLYSLHAGQRHASSGIKRWALEQGWGAGGQPLLCAAVQPLRVSRATASITLPAKPAGLGFRRTRTNPLAPPIDAAVRDTAVLAHAIAGNGCERSGGRKIAPYVRRGEALVR